MNLTSKAFSNCLKLFSGSLKNLNAQLKRNTWIKKTAGH